MAAPKIEAVIYDDGFLLKNVTIGRSFHWERREDQRFAGRLMIVKHGGLEIAVNDIDVEEYLVSVISSEMKADLPFEALKAHAVISRGWVLNQKLNRNRNQDGMVDNDREVIRWYDNNDHKLFDVCADDHCQRYQGITRATSPRVRAAVEATRGRVLLYGGELCDARFSKCCGGVMEQFSTCWGDEDYPYLMGKRDASSSFVPDLSNEDEARRWILSRPESYCDVRDEALLHRIMNSYDCETTDFYRWEKSYTVDELTEIFRTKSGRDVGRIVDLLPLERGASGRISLLRVVGECGSLLLGKELEIRRVLSESHLYSSAFVVDKYPGGFVFHGAGWGHGVGLCQIGAAVMACRGCGCEEILSHYYPGTVYGFYNIEK